MKNIILTVILLITLSACNLKGKSDNSKTQLPFNYKIIYPVEDVNVDTPVLFLIHGYGANSDDLLFIKDFISRDFIIVSLEAPIEKYDNGYSWFDIRFVNGMVSSIDEVAAAKCTKDLGSFIENLLAEVNPGCNNVFILGFSQGAYLALDLYLNNPEKEYSVAVLSGMINTDKLSETPECTGSLFVAHGLYDEVIPITEGRKIRDNFQSCENLSYHEYEINHTIGEDELRDLSAWFDAILL